MPQITKCTFVTEHGIFTSPNAQTLPYFPLLELIHDCPDPRTLGTPTWANNRWIALGFVPLRPRYDRPFDVLRPRHDGSFAIEEIGKKWRIKPSLARSWRRLQSNLLTLLMHVSSQSNMLLPVGSELFHLPSAYGFDSQHFFHSFGRAQRAALESAAAFRILMAVCSLYILHESNFINGIPRWEAALVKAGIDQDEIALYKRSELCDFGPDYPRAGVVFKPDALFLHLVPYFLKAHVPIWFLWVKNATGQQYAHGFDKYRPTSSEIDQATIPTQESSIDNATSSAPTPVPGSGQLLGEDPDAYRARYLIRRQKRMEDETPEQKLAREQREEQHRIPSLPGRKGPTCWLWEQQEDGWWLKNRVSRNEVEDDWQTWAHEQMFYDSIRNEWNICEDWAPDAIAPIEDDDFGLEDIDDYMNPHPPPLSMSSRNWNTVHVWHDHCADAREDMETLHLPTISLLDILVNRFGFSVGSAEPPADPKSWQLTLRTLVEQRASDVPSHLHKQISTFVSMIATNDIKALPSNSWDLLDHHHGGWAAANLFSLRKDLTEQGDRWYTIKPINGPHVSWQLAVSSARTALHCFREIYETGTIREVVALFICMGIPFQTLQVTSVLSQPEMRYRAIPLAWRLSGDHRPAREYAEYERVLREFLRRPYARAALLRGGIVWRLAMNEFGLDDAIELAMLGPSRDACEHGFTLSFPGQCHLHDDSITDAEADLICGTYKQSTSDPNQVLEYSWWPKQANFFQSGLWVGHWTRQCEDWFLGRQRELRTRGGKMRRSTEWRSALSLRVTTTRKFADNHERVCEEYIDAKRPFA